MLRIFMNRRLSLFDRIHTSIFTLVKYLPSRPLSHRDGYLSLWLSGNDGGYFYIATLLVLVRFLLETYLQISFYLYVCM